MYQNHERSLLVVWLLISLIVIAVIGALSTLSWIQYTKEILAGIPIDDVRTDLINSNTSIIRTIQSSLSIASVVAFLLWFYRAHQNIAIGGLYGLRYTHGWAVGGFFIPFLNLVRPYRAMSEVYRGSLALAEEMEVELWQSLPISPLVKWWWVLFWVRVASSRISNSMLESVGAFNDLLSGFWVLFASDLVDVAAALVTIFLIRDITQMQTKAQSNHFVIKLYPGGEK